MKQIESITVGEGGEVLEAKIKTIKNVNAEQFCQIYLQENEEFFQLSKSESNILAVCWYVSVYYDDKDFNLPGNKVTLDEQTRDIIGKKTKLASGTIKNTITSLVKKDMLIKDDKYKSIYYLNPKYFFKGKITDRTKVIQQTIEYRIG